MQPSPSGKTEGPVVPRRREAAGVVPEVVVSVLSFFVMEREWHDG